MDHSPGRSSKFLVHRRPFLGRIKKVEKSIGVGTLVRSGDANHSLAKKFFQEGCILCFFVANSKTIFESLNNEFEEFMSSLNQGDEIVVSCLECLGRTQIELTRFLLVLSSKGIYLRTLDGLINTRDFGHSSFSLLNLISSLLQFEKKIIKQKVLDSIQERKARGASIGGRPKTSKAKVNLVIKLRNEGYSYRSIKDQTGLSISTIRRIILEGDQYFMHTSLNEI